MRILKDNKRFFLNSSSKIKGYAILFTVVVVSVISLIAIGLTNTSYKQLILSSVAKDSHLAFFQSDTATECALYLDNRLDMQVGGNPITATPVNWKCGINADGTDYTLGAYVDSSGGGTTQYKLNAIAGNDAGMLSSATPCFKIDIDKKSNGTKVSAYGYNVCDANSLRKVEREIDVNY